MCTHWKGLHRGWLFARETGLEDSLKEKEKTVVRGGVTWGPVYVNVWVGMRRENTTQFVLEINRGTFLQGCIWHRGDSQCM